MYIIFVPLTKRYAPTKGLGLGTGKTDTSLGDLLLGKSIASFVDVGSVKHFPVQAA